MWINQSVKSENRNLISESDVSSHCRTNYKAKKCTTLQCSYAADAFSNKDLVYLMSPISCPLQDCANKKRANTNKRGYTCQHIIQMSIYQEKTPE